MSDRSPWHTPESTAQLVQSFKESRDAEVAFRADNGFTVSNMPSLVPGIHPGRQDTMHMYTDLQGCSKPGGGSYDHTWLTVFFYQDPGFPDKRYVILADHATGARIKVDLPPRPGKESAPDEPDSGSMYELVREQGGSGS